MIVDTKFPRYCVYYCCINHFVAQTLSRAHTPEGWLSFTWYDELVKLYEISDAAVRKQSATFLRDAFPAKLWKTGACLHLLGTQHVDLT